MKKIKLRGTKGITLIALVVTIVVLLILAGVSIAMLTGEDGIIKQAQRAEDATEIAEERDKVNLAELWASSKNRLGNILKEDLISELNELIGEGKYTLDGNGPYTVTFKESGRSYVVNPEKLEEIEAGKRYEKKQKVTVGNDIVTIPGGATVSGIPEESKSVDDGIVMYLIPEGEKVENWEADSNNNGIKDVQEKYDQFVWVPVETAYVTEEEVNAGIENLSDVEKYENLKTYIKEKNIYPMAIKLADGSYKGILYTFEGTTSVTITPMDYTETAYNNGANREPAYLTNTTYGDASSIHKNGVIEEGQLETEYNAMVGRVANNRGFWVGRYETTNMSATDDNQQIKIIKGATEGISSPSQELLYDNGITWYRMYAQQKYYSTSISISMTSSMIWGSQWDQIMIWMKDVDNTEQNSKYIVNALGMGNFNLNDDGYSDTKTPAPTGCFEVKHIYDLAGNVQEWTLEAKSDMCRMHRGHDLGSDGENHSPSMRGINHSYTALYSFGTRASLY